MTQDENQEIDKHVFNLDELGSQLHKKFHTFSNLT